MYINIEEIEEISLYVKEAKDQRIEGTKDFIQKLHQIEEITKDSSLVTLDVKSLHTNIRNNEGIKTVKEAYDKHPNKTV